MREVGLRLSSPGLLDADRRDARVVRARLGSARSRRKRRSARTARPAARSLARSAPATACACACACVTAVRARVERALRGDVVRLVGVGLALRDVALREQLVVARDGLLRERERALRLGDVRSARSRSRRSMRSPSPARRARRPTAACACACAPRPRPDRRSAVAPEACACASLCASDACAWSSAAWNVVGSSFARTLALLHVRVEVGVDLGDRPRHLRADADRVLRVERAARGDGLRERARLHRNGRVRRPPTRASARRRSRRRSRRSPNRRNSEPPARAPARGLELDGGDVAVGSRGPFQCMHG